MSKDTISIDGILLALFLLLSMPLVYHNHNTHTDIRKETKIMSTPMTITTTGRVATDLELKTSQGGRNIRFAQFSLAVNEGCGESNRPNHYKCLPSGGEAQRIIDAKAKKGSLIQIVEDLDLEEFEKRDGSTGWSVRVILLSWNYTPTSRPKEDSLPEENNARDNQLIPTKDCGENGLPFN